MAKGKGKNTVGINMDIDDNGTLRKTGKKAKQTGKDMKGMTDQAHSADRAMKGVSRQSSNTTKNFSKMSQGLTGGLVPAYATLAANIFALGAAFRFLKDAADYRLLMEGQRAYAATTGVAYKTLTNQIIEATAGQITFAEAAQAAAIGTAAGLNADQLERLGNAAKLASIALGRDVTDAFNRLVRGTTKAEPELLDELGIILRLDTALEKYASRLDKNKEALTQFEKSQAITNDVLEQAESKFGAIAMIMEPNVNQLNLMAKAFDDMTNSLKLAIAPTAEFLATFFSENVLAASGALLLLATPIIKTIIPSYDEFEKRTTVNLERHKQKINDATNAINLYGNAATRSQMKGAQALGASTTSLQGMAGKLGAGTKGTGLAELQAGRGITPRQAANIKSQIARNVGQFKNMDAKIKANWLKTLDEMSAAHKQYTGKTKVDLKKMGLNWRLYWEKIKLQGEKTYSALKRAQMKFMKAFSIAMSAISYASIAFLAFGMIKEGIEWLRGYGDSASRAESEIAKMLRTQKDLNKEIADMMGGRKALRDIDAPWQDQIKMAGKALTSAAVGPGLEKMARQQAEIARRGPADLSMQGTAREQRGVFEGYLEGPDSAMGIYNAAKLKEIAPTLTEIMERYEKIGKPIKTAGDLSSAYAQYGHDTINMERELAEAQDTLLIRLNSMVDEYPFLKEVIKDVEEGKFKLTQQTDQEIIGYQNASAAISSLQQTADKYNKTQSDYLGFTGNKHLNFLQDVTERYEKMQQVQNAPDEFKFIKDEEGNITKEKNPEWVKWNDATIAFGAYKKLLEEHVKGAISTEAQVRNYKLLNAEIKGSMIGATDYGKKLQQLNNIKAQEAKIDQLRADLRFLEASDFAAQGYATEREFENRKSQLTDEIKLTSQLKTNLEATIDPLKQIGTAAATNIEQGLGNAMMGVIEGTKSMKEGFLEMAKAVLQAIAQIIVKLIAMKAIEAMGFGFAEGGVIPRANGGYMFGGRKPKGYRSGGVVTEPTYLVGEGKYNEAVVPLPDGRSIPVQMSGGASNVSVNVNVASDGQTTSSLTQNNGQQAAQLGRAISTAVQEELLKQQRPGGMLSPYGP